MTYLLDKSCQRETRLLEAHEQQLLLNEVPDWQCTADGTSLFREFRFADYAGTLAFVNKVAAIAVQQDHHPDISFGYNRCTVSYSTHSVGGLSENDFICAAHIDAIAG